MHYLRCYLLLLVPTLSAASSRLYAPTQTSALPHYQRLRVNDTLVLEVSRPLARFGMWQPGAGDPPMRARPTTVLWGRAALRGHRGYYEVLHPYVPYCTLYRTVVSGRGDVLALTYWNDLDNKAPRARTHPRDTVWVTRSKDLGYTYWDVRYRTWSQLLGDDLQELPAPLEAEEVVGFEGSVVGFAGGTYQGRSYHFLPYWLTHELARVRRTRRLPPAPRLDAFLGLAYDGSGVRLTRPYRPLLTQLLRAYTACPQSSTTARQVAEAQQVMAASRP
jgi:hypothetical protein